MLFLKGLSLIGVIVICSYLGIIKAKTFENRVSELSKFQNALVMFKTKIEYKNEPIKNIFGEITKVIYKDEENIFLYTIKNQRNIYVSWNEGADKIKKDFTKEDIEIIKMMGKLLGKTDIEGQVNEIELTKSLIEKQIEKAELEKIKNSKLYKTMGVICGIGICIILI